MQLHEYVRLIRRRWRTAVLALVLVELATVLFAVLQHPRYEATARVYVATTGGSTITDLSQSAVLVQQTVKGYADVATTPYVLGAVVTRLGLPETPAQLAPDVEVASDTDSPVLSITVTYPDAARAAAIANAVAVQLTGAVDTLTPGSALIGSPIKLTQVQTAVRPDAPSSPNLPLDFALGTLAALIAALFAAALRDRLDTRVRAVEEVREATDLPVLVGLPHRSGLRRRGAHPLDDPRGATSESMQLLRLNLQFLNVGNPALHLLVTSAVAGEGKSTLVAHLGPTLAATGLTVVVDADLRRPRLTEYLGVSSGFGLSDVLIGRARLEEVVQESSTPGLWVLPAGTLPPNPAALLESEEMSAVLETLRQEFLNVVLDVPPLLAASDAAILARRSLGVIMVAGLGQVRLFQTRRALDAMAQTGARVLGVVATRVPPSGPRGYGDAPYGQEAPRPAGGAATTAVA